MVKQFKLPDVGEGLTEGMLVQWLVKVGDTVKEDQAIAKLETDKAVVEIPSPYSGTILKINHKEGETIKVGEVLIEVGDAGEKPTTRAAEEAPKLEEALPEPAVPKKKESVGVVGQLEIAPEEPETPVVKPATTAMAQHATSTVLATPKIRKLAKDKGINLNTVTGTGPEGRITESDLTSSAKVAPKISTPASATGKKSVRKYDQYGFLERIPYKGIRKTIGNKMMKSLQGMAQVTHMDECDVTHLVEIRNKEKVIAKEKGIKLTYLPFIIKACAAAFKKYPKLNASLDEEAGDILIKKYYNVAVSVQTEAGLMVVVLKRVEIKSILEIAKELDELANKAKDRTINLADLKGQSFTITSPGSLGGIFSTPIINPPDVAILGVHKIQEKPVVRDGKIEIRKVLPLAVTFDHRVVDGADAALWLNEVMKHLSDPALLLIGA
ncbi:MAG: 2-oxo acid dehydrogenase subunit E2 [Candidatus Diapherotrites archaeon]|nr:2-oxo acid dehydrogenase subunit E2 [Candidatus Diapherotrites archaeon]